MGNWERQEKRQIEEYRKRPFINLSDSINRAEIGNWNALTSGDCLVKILTTLVIVGGLLAFLYFK